MEDQELDSFYFKENINGVEHDYRITQHANHYGVEFDGIVIAELKLNELGLWEQTSGVKLPPEVIEKIGDKIEDHYE